MPVFQLSDEPIFPLPEMAEPDGLLAVGGDLSPERLLKAYSMGIFPWYSQGDPILWWSPSPRLILDLEDFKISRRLQRLIGQGRFRVTVDQAFSEVIRSCAKTPRPLGDGTWVTPEMIEAYCHLHELGYAHSIESWVGDELAGGLYGVAIAKVFFGESMFASVTDSSKVALAALVAQIKKWDFDFIDCQVKTDHLISLGAKEISGEEFRTRLARAVNRPSRKGKWEFK